MWPVDFPLSSYAWTHAKGAGKAKGRPTVTLSSDCANLLYPWCESTFFWPAQIYTDFRVDFGEYFFTGWKVFFLILSAANLDSGSIPRLFVILKGCFLWKLGALMIPSASVLYAAVIWRISIWSYTALTAGLHGALLSAAARAAMSTEDAPHSAAARQFHHQRSVLTRHSHPWWKRHD